MVTLQQIPLAVTATLALSVVSVDPFDDVTPIRPKQPKQLAAISAGEKRERARVTHAQTAGAKGLEKLRTTGNHEARSRSKMFSRRPLRADELVEMTSQLARSLHHDSFDERAKAAERKHFAIGYAVMVDKLNALAGRPTSILAFADDRARAGVLELAGRLALAAKESGAA